VAELLEALLERHPHGTVYVAWDNAKPHEDDDVEAVLRGAAGRLVLLYLPTDSPWLNPAEMLWRHYRREVTRDVFDRMNQTPDRTPSILGAHPA
jgi:putative transposase